MYYCKKCAEKYKYPIRDTTHNARCEVCNKMQVCYLYSVPSPELLPNEKEKKEKPELAVAYEQHGEEYWRQSKGATNPMSFADWWQRMKDKMCPPLQVTNEQRRKGEEVAKYCMEKQRFFKLSKEIRSIAEAINHEDMTADEWEELAQQTAIHLAALCRIADMIRETEPRGE